MSRHRTDLAAITMVNGVNPEGKPFVTVSATGADGTILIGQLSPDEVRAHGLSYLACAEAAEQDAAVFQVLHDLDLLDGNADQMSALIIHRLRAMREEP